MQPLELHAELSWSRRAFAISKNTILKSLRSMQIIVFRNLHIGIATGNIYVCMSHSILLSAIIYVQRKQRYLCCMKLIRQNIFAKLRIGPYDYESIKKSMQNLNFSISYWFIRQSQYSLHFVLKTLSKLHSSRIN